MIVWTEDVERVDERLQESFNCSLQVKDCGDAELGFEAVDDVQFLSVGESSLYMLLDVEFLTC